MNGIILRPLTNYGLQNYLRVSVGKDAENKKFITALKKLVTTRKKNV